MTIAAGLIGDEGIVIAADTKEGYGDVHTYVDKITLVDTFNCKAAIASSGESYLLDYITPLIQQALKSGDIKSATIFRGRLQELMGEIYQSPQVKNYPVDKAADLYTQFLVGVKFANDRYACLFLVNSTLVTEPTKWGTIIGCGPLVEMGEELGLISCPSIKAAQAAGLHVVHEAKRRYSDVGGFTHVTSILNAGAMAHESVSDQVEKELLLDELRHVNNSILVSSLDPTLKGREFNILLRVAIRRVREVHQKAINIEINSDKTARRENAKRERRTAKLRTKLSSSQK